MDLNKVMLVGRITNDLELKKFNDNSVLNFNLATNANYTTKDGTKVENTEFHKCVVFGKLADIMAEYLGKGRKIFVEGKLRTRQWEDQNGNKRYTTEIIVNNMNFCDSGNGGNKPNTNSEETTEEEDIPF